MKIKQKKTTNSSKKKSAEYVIPTFKMLKCHTCNKMCKVDGDTVKVICSLCSAKQPIKQFQKDEEVKKLKKKKII